jgi:MerR family transcriptional regulator, light-induced transcriptional regulator
VSMTPVIDKEVYDNYLACLLAGQRVQCASIVKELLHNQVPARRLYLDLFQASMYEVGELWAVNRISVATEHVTSAITEGLLNLVLSSVSYQPRTGKKAVVAGVQPELHQLGSRIVADTLEISGWDSLFVGGNTPIGELRRLIRETSPALVALSLTMRLNQSALRTAIDEIHAEFPAQHVIVGGQGLSEGTPWGNEARRQVTHVPSLDELDSFVSQFG